MRYPKAEWLGNGQSGGSYTSGPFKVVLHTTETRTLPSYQSGASAPHLTYSPASRRWWQHTDFDTAARALRNMDGGIQTNRDSVLQVEIICYSSKSTADYVGGTWVGDLPDHAYIDLREFLVWTELNFSVDASKWPGRQALSYSEANASGFRLSNSEWDSFNGVCGHQHVPENYHWDPGALDWSRLITSDMGGDDFMWTKGLDENGWRTLARLGIAAGGEILVVDYWWTNRAHRTDSEHLQASANMIVAIASRSGNVDDEARSMAAEALVKLANIKGVL